MTHVIYVKEEAVVGIMIAHQQTSNAKEDMETGNQSMATIIADISLGSITEKLNGNEKEI